jgi:glycosyltransferase involved in cell wall biosynthesis
MIVIATNNSCVERICRGENIPRKNFLDSVLTSINEINYNGEVLVVDTGSTDQESIEFLETLKEKKFKFNLIIEKIVQNFSINAYIYAFENYDSDEYIFLQDSIKIKDDKFIDIINNTLNDNNLMCWVVCSTCGFDTEEQKQFVFNATGDIFYDKLIFGPIFFGKKNVIKKIFSQIKLRPSIKSEDSGMERGLGVLCKQNNIEIISIDGEFNFYAMVNNLYKYITKYHADRK